MIGLQNLIYLKEVSHPLKVGDKCLNTSLIYKKLFLVYQYIKS